MASWIRSVSDRWNNYYYTPSEVEILNKNFDAIQEEVGKWISADKVTPLKPLVKIIMEYGFSDQRIKQIIFQIFENESWRYPLSSAPNQAFVQKFVGYADTFITPYIRPEQTERLKAVAGVIAKLPTIRGLTLFFSVEQTEPLTDFYSSIATDTSQLSSLTLRNSTLATYQTTLAELDIATTRLPKLRQLHVDSLLSPEAWNVDASTSISRLTMLRSLQIRGIIAEELAMICRNCKAIEELSVYGERLSASNSIATISMLPQLTVLDISGMIGMSIEALHHLTELDPCFGHPGLVALRVQGCWHSRTRIRLLPLNTESGRFVDVHDDTRGISWNPFVENENVRNQAGKFIKAVLPTLRALDVSYNELSEEDYKQFESEHFPKLKQLIMKAGDGDPIKATSICKISSLEELDFSGYEIDSRQFQILTQMPNLTSLTCGGWKTRCHVSFKNRIDEFHKNYKELKEALKVIKNQKTKLTIRFKTISLETIVLYGLRSGVEHFHFDK